MFEETEMSALVGAIHGLYGMPPFRRCSTVRRSYSDAVTSATDRACGRDSPLLRAIAYARSIDVRIPVQYRSIQVTDTNE